MYIDFLFFKSAKEYYINKIVKMYFVKLPKGGPPYQGDPRTLKSASVHLFVRPRRALLVLVMRTVFLSFPRGKYQ